jgi:hypothetical protein
MLMVNHRMELLSRYIQLCSIYGKKIGRSRQVEEGRARPPTCAGLPFGTESDLCLTRSIQCDQIARSLGRANIVIVDPTNLARCLFVLRSSSWKVLAGRVWRVRLCDLLILPVVTATRRKKTPLTSNPCVAAVSPIAIMSMLELRFINLKHGHLSIFSDVRARSTTRYFLIV